MNQEQLHNWTLDAHVNKRFDDAIAGYNELIGKNPDTWYYPYTLGTLFLEIGKNGVAIPLFQRSLAVEEKPETLVNLGICFRQEGHEKRAEQCYERAWNLKEDPMYLNNWTGLYVNAGEPDKCIELCDRALALSPDSSQVLSHKSLALLEKGSYKEGWDIYDARFGIESWHNRKYPGEMWDGRRAKNPQEVLVLHGEQGVGDEILFMSLLYDAQKQWGGKVVIECHKKLVKLFGYSFNLPCFETSKELLEMYTPSAWLPMGSLPRVLKYYDPPYVKHPSRERKPYLQPSPYAENVYPKTDERPRIGLSWYGGTKQTHSHLRNFGMEKWKRLIKPEIEYVSLQYGDAEREANELGIKYVPVGDDLDEFARRVASCDLVITVCNTTVHFAGALNVPAWVLVPSKPAWRYGISGDRMFWYPHTRMFRQTSTWNEVIDQVESALLDMVPPFRGPLEERKLIETP